MGKIAWVGAVGLPLVLTVVLGLRLMGACGLPNGATANLEGGADSDDDGFADDVESYLGTDPFDNCADGPFDDAWPLDINRDTIATILDVVEYRPHIGATGGPPPSANWRKRTDLNADNYVTVTGDVRLYRGVFGSICNGGTPHPPPPPPQGTPVSMDVDPDTTGNSANTLGPTEDCVRVDIVDPAFDNVSDYNIDIVVTGDTQAPVAYDAELVYDSAKIHVAAPGTNNVIKMPGALDFGDVLPDSDGIYHTGALSPVGSGIAGDGALARVGLDVGGSGLVTFSLNSKPQTAYASDAAFHCGVGPAPDCVRGTAQLAINQDCPGMATPTPTPPPVGGIAEVPNVAEVQASRTDSPTGTYTAPAAGLAAALLALTASAWYVRRRWGGRACT